MLSDLRKRKLARFFEVVDTDRDGVFTPADTELVGQRLTELRGLEPGSKEHSNFMSVFRFYWEDVRKACDADGDGRVTMQEWIDYHTVMLEDRDRFDGTVQNSASMMFALMDADGDGVISTDEYRAWMGAWGMADAAKSEQVFARLDPDGKGSFSKEQVLEFTREFFYSDDENAAGNWAMGPY